MVYRQVEPTLTWRMEVHEQRTALLLQEVVQEVSPQGWSLYTVTSDGSAFTSEPPGTSDPQHLLWWNREMVSTAEVRMRMARTAVSCASH